MTPTIHDVLDALDALEAADGGVGVHGNGPLAAELRRRYGPATSCPPIVIETTGTTVGIVTALADVADLGHVILAGPDDADGPDLDLYADLHLRGVTLVGTGNESSSSDR